MKDFGLPPPRLPIRPGRTRTSSSRLLTGAALSAQSSPGAGNLSDSTDVLSSRGTRADRTPPQGGKPCQWLGDRAGAALLSCHRPVVCSQYQRLPPDMRYDARYDDNAETRSWLRLLLRRLTNRPSGKGVSAERSATFRSVVMRGDCGVNGSKALSDLRTERETNSDA